MIARDTNREPPNPLPPPRLGLVSPDEIDGIMDMLDRHEDKTGEDVREQLIDMLASVDPDFDPDMSAMDMSNRDLLESVFKAVVTLEGDALLGGAAEAE